MALAKTLPKINLSAIQFVKIAQKYSRKDLKADFIAALTVAIVALPQSMAYAVIAGVHPKYGIYAAIIPVIISSLFGSSRFLIAGPTNAISMVVASTTASIAIGGTVINNLPEEQKMAALFLLTAMVGVIQVVMGAAKLGGLLNFVSHSVVIGFTAGAGVLIAANQLKNLLGISIGSSNEFIETLHRTFTHLESTNIQSLSLGLGTIMFIVGMKKISAKIPGSLLAMVISAAFVAFFDMEASGVKLIGDIPRSLPPISVPSLDPSNIKILFTPALAIAILGIVEALSIAKSVANSSGEKINGNQEFVAQGLANISAGFFSSIPGSGSFTRTAVNFRSGAHTNFSGVYSGVFVLLTLIALAPLAKFIPIASLAGILLVIAYSMIDQKALAFSFKATRADRAVLIVTILATLFLDLEIAVYVGVLLSIALFLRKVSHPQIYKVTPRETDNKLIPYTKGCRSCSQVSIFQIDGSLFFGAVSELEQHLTSLGNGKEKIVIVRMKGVRILDATGAHALEKFLQTSNAKNTKVIFTGVRPAVRETLANTGLIKKIGNANIAEDTTVAIKTALKKYIDPAICKKCKCPIFFECNK